MDTLSVIIYGVVQGLTEFLPVSSSAHLALLPHFLHIKDPGPFFDLAMHLGTLLAVFIYFHDEVKRLTLGFFRLIFFRPQKLTDRNFTINLLLGFLGTTIVALLLKNIALSIGRSPQLIAINLIIFGLFLYLSDRVFSYNERLFDEKVSPLKALFVGAMQALALFPGVSRSGVTIMACRLLRLSRKDATRYSFLLALPVIAGGALLELPHFFMESRIDLEVILLGAFVSFLVGIISIYLLIQIISRVGVLPFFIYRVLLAIVIFIFLKS